MNEQTRQRYLSISNAIVTVLIAAYIGAACLLYLYIKDG